MNNQDFFREIIELHKDTLAKIRKHGIKITLRELIGEEIWSTFTKSEKLTLGSVFHEMVINNELAIKCFGKRSNNSRIYG